MSIQNFLRTSLLFIASFLILSSCGCPGDERKIPPNADDRFRKNIEEGRGFRLGNFAGPKSGEFDFASSNELWRASLDTLDFMPLALANYSGGIIVTDWYSDENATNESIKISIRFLSNDIRSDAIAIKVFYKECSLQTNCKVVDRTNELSAELTKQILTKAAVYEKENKNKTKKRKYINKKLGD